MIGGAIAGAWPGTIMGTPVEYGSTSVGAPGIIGERGASVRAESAPGAGATFYFTLNPDSDG